MTRTVMIRADGCAMYVSATDAELFFWRCAYCDEHHGKERARCDNCGAYRTESIAAAAWERRRA